MDKDEIARFLASEAQMDEKVAEPLADAFVRHFAGRIVRPEAPEERA